MVEEGGRWTDPCSGPSGIAAPDGGAAAAPDHPVHPFLPESAYLKTLVLELD